MTVPNRAYFRIEVSQGLLKSRVGQIVILGQMKYNFVFCVTCIKIKFVTTTEKNLAYITNCIAYCVMYKGTITSEDN